MEKEKKKSFLIHKILTWYLNTEYIKAAFVILYAFKGGMKFYSKVSYKRIKRRVVFE